MKFTNIYDMHTHSDHSFDGNHSCVELCESALKKGAKGIAITDHLDIDDPELDVRALVTNQFVDTFSTKKMFEKDLEVFQGIELGQGIYRKEESEKILSEFSYDFVLGSIHNLDNMKDFYFLDFTEFDSDKLIEDYFRAEYELAVWDKTDSLAHLTYPFRYAISKFDIHPDINKYKDTIIATFETLIKNGKALEVNASSLNSYHRDFMPPKEYVMLYKDLGGKYITVGSDAHYHQGVCSNIDKSYELAAQCGFDKITVFRKREPILIDLK